MIQDSHGMATQKCQMTRFLEIILEAVNSRDDRIY